MAGILPEGTTAWYFGADYAAFRASQDRLSPTIRWGDTGRRLNEISERHTDDFVNLSDWFVIDDWDWWESRNLAERGPLSSTIVTECCRMILFGDCLRNGGSHMFICEDRDLGRVLLAAARWHKVSARWVGPSGPVRAARALAAQTLDALRLARAVVKRIGRLRRLKRLRKRHPLPLAQLRQCDVLFAAWTEPGDFPRNALRDSAHYMGVLPRELRARGVTAGYVALPLDWISDGDAINADCAHAHDTVISADDTATPTDVLRAAFGSIALRARPRDGLMVGGQSMAGIARMVLRRERFDWRAVNARLLAGVGPYLSAHGCRPRVLFHVYENQTWEKGLRTGCRRALPDMRIAGIHQSPFSNLYLNMLASRQEIESGRWPDVVFTLGAYSRARLTSTAAPKQRVLDGGLFRPGSFILPRLPEARESGRVVVATGVNFHECCELAAKAHAAVILAKQPWTLVVNFHPATSPSFRSGLRRFMERQGATGLVFTEQSISSVLKDGVAVVLYADTNAAFEAVSSGARAINVERDHELSFDKLPDGLSRRLCSEDDIAVALDQAGDDGLWPADAEVAATLDACFSPADADKVATALALGENGPGSGRSIKEMEQR